MSDDADEAGREKLVGTTFSIAGYIATATKIVADLIARL